MIPDWSSVFCLQLQIFLNSCPISTWHIFQTNQQVQWANGAQQMLPIWARAEAPSQIAWAAIVYNLALPSNFPKYLCHLSPPEADQLHKSSHPPTISSPIKLILPSSIFGLSSLNLLTNDHYKTKLSIYIGTIQYPCLLPCFVSTSIHVVNVSVLTYRIDNRLPCS